MKSGRGLAVVMAIAASSPVHDAQRSAAAKLLRIDEKAVRKSIAAPLLAKSNGKGKKEAKGKPLAAATPVEARGKAKKTATEQLEDMGLLSKRGDDTDTGTADDEGVVDELDGGAELDEVMEDMA